MKRIDNWRLGLGYLSVLLLGIINIRVNSLRSFIGIVSFVVVVVSSILLSLAARDQQLKAMISSYFYHAEFVVILGASLFNQKVFRGARICFFVLALALYVTTWILYFRKKKVK